MDRSSRRALRAARGAAQTGLHIAGGVVSGLASSINTAAASRGWGSIFNFASGGEPSAQQAAATVRGSPPAAEGKHLAGGGEGSNEGEEGEEGETEAEVETEGGAEGVARLAKHTKMVVSALLPNTP